MITDVIEGFKFNTACSKILGIKFLTSCTYKQLNLYNAQIFMTF